MKRQFIRHPATVPIEYSSEGNHDLRFDRARNISEGGLCIEAEEYVDPGSRLRLRIEADTGPFMATGLVVWCQSMPHEHYLLGIKFTDRDTIYAVRMVEQVCHIEDYRQQVASQEGRILTHEQAAAEWISRYAEDFP